MTWNLGRTIIAVACLTQAPVLLSEDVAPVAPAPAPADATLRTLLAGLEQRLNQQQGRVTVVVTAESRCIADLHMDSLDLAEFAMDLEDALHVRIPEADQALLSELAIGECYRRWSQLEKAK